MFGLGTSEMLIVGVLAVLLFGSRLPSVARSLGKSLTEFRRGMQDLQDDFRKSFEDEERVARRPQRPALPSATNAANSTEGARAEGSRGTTTAEPGVAPADASAGDDATHRESQPSGAV